MSEIVAVERADYERLAAFHAAFPDERHDAAFWLRRFRYWWDDNPGHDAVTPRGWLLLDDDGAVAGFLGQVASAFQHDGRTTCALGATTWRVLPRARALSIHLYLAHLDAANGAVLFNTTPSPAVTRILDHFKFRARPSFPSRRAFLIALRGTASATAALRERHLPRSALVAGGALLRLAQAPLEALLSATRARDVEVLARADASFDELWQRTRGRYASTTIRSARFLDWWCFGGDDFRKVLIACRARGRLRGYVVLTPAVWRDARVLELADLWTEDDAPDVVRALVAGAWRHARRGGYDVLVLHDFTVEHARLYRRLGVLYTSPDDHHHHYRLDADGAAELPARDSYLTSIEGDRTL